MDPDDCVGYGLKLGVLDVVGVSRSRPRQPGALRRLETEDKLSRAKDAKVDGNTGRLTLAVEDVLRCRRIHAEDIVPFRFVPDEAHLNLARIDNNSVVPSDGVRFGLADVLRGQYGKSRDKKRHRDAHARRQEPYGTNGGCELALHRS